MPVIIYSTGEVDVANFQDNDTFVVINPDRLDDFDYTFDMINVVMDVVGSVADGPDTMRLVAHLAFSFLQAHGEETALTLERYV